MNEEFEKWWNTYDKGGMACFDECNDAYQAGAAAERERCAEIAEDYMPPTEWLNTASVKSRKFLDQTCVNIAAAIRKEADSGGT